MKTNVHNKNTNGKKQQALPPTPSNIPGDNGPRPQPKAQAPALEPKIISSSMTMDVYIGGKLVTVKSDESPEYIEKVSRYVDDKMLALKSKNLSASVDERLRSILLALNIADDYFKAKELYTAREIIAAELTAEVDSLKREITDIREGNDSLQPPSAIANIATLQAENGRLTKEVAQLNQELEKISADFEEFLASLEL